MSDEVLRLLEPICPVPVSFAAGAVVFRVDDPIQHVYVVRSGTIHLIRYHQNGSALVLQRAGAGAILAEASVFSDRYHCDAVAVTATGACAISRHALRHRLATDGSFAETWMKHLAREVQSARFQAEMMSIRTVSGRLDAWLALGRAVPPKGEWVALAAQMGVSPEALYREMAKRRM